MLPWTLSLRRSDMRLLDLLSPSPASEVEDRHVTIANDDLDENPYTFTLTGNGVAEPEIGVRQGVTGIASGTGSYDFGNVAVGSSSAEITFTVENLGMADLELNGTPLVVIGGVNPTLFTVTTQPDSPVPPSGAPCSIVFSPSSNGAKRATVSIASNDAGRESYLRVKGRGRSGARRASPKNAPIGLSNHSPIGFLACAPR
jgi:hypothetical protein